MNSKGKLELTITWDLATGDWYCKYDGPNNMHFLQLEAVLMKGVELFRDTQDANGFCNMANTFEIEEIEEPMN